MLSEEKDDGSIAEHQDGIDKTPGNENTSRWKDVFKINRTMLKYKIFYLFFIGASSSIITFLPLQMKQLGLSPSRIGIASSVRPFTAALSTAIIGLASDKIGYRRAWMVGLLMAMLGSGVALSLLRTPELATCDGIYDMEVTNLTLTKRSLISGEYNYRKISIDRRDVTLSTNTSKHVGAKYNEEGNINSKHPHDLHEDRSWQYDPRDLFRVFIEVLAIGSIFEMAMSPVYAIADASVMVALTREGNDVSEYGGTRGWGNIAWDLGGFLTGLLLQFSRHNIIQCGVSLTNANYVIVLIPFGLLMIGSLASLSILRFSNSDYNDSGTHWEYLKILLTPHYFIMFTAILFFGICNGAVWGFLFWHLDNLGATHGILSFVTLFQAASEIPAGYASSLSIKYLGYWNSLNVGFLTYTVRFLWIYVTKNPWWIVPTEILNGFAFAQTWNVLISYMSNAVPANLFVTVCGFCSALYFGIGVALGYLITGWLVEHFGGAATFGYYAIVSFILSLIFAILIRIVIVPTVTFDDTASDTDSTDKTSPVILSKTKTDGENTVLLSK
ncbi:major facilitator superfamily domain-containing protein 6-like [Amphiura filiformis]|uniref:major facilitator superfamily domain-containing protein 6-like n=1 Tax=Amphiura filiformis TaxID=82378 RepID=UPI003B21E7FB